MANLETIKTLNIKFGKKSAITKSDLFSKSINEGYLNQNLDYSSLNKAYSAAFTQMGSNYSEHFDKGLSTEVALLYIDICAFSTRFSHLNGSSIADFFDAYYSLVIPIIYEFGGEIDKVMGDGIICSFGPPFYNYPLTMSLLMANKCASTIIEKTMGGKFESKVAMHAGKINYFKNKTGFYNEFTMIGKPLTELFRLEGITDGPVISFFDDTEVSTSMSVQILVDQIYELQGIENPDKWTYDLNLIENLKGADYTSFYTKKLK